MQEKLVARLPKLIGLAAHVSLPHVTDPMLRLDNPDPPQGIKVSRFYLCSVGMSDLFSSSPVTSDSSVHYDSSLSSALENAASPDCRVQCFS